MEGGLPNGSSYLLLGSKEEGGALMLIDDAKSFEDAAEKATLFLQEHPEGGVLINKHLAACYRLPLFPVITH